MDTRTGEFVILGKQEEIESKELWQLWKAGLLTEIPKYAPVDGDSIPVKPKTLRRKPGKGSRATRSWRNFANG